MWEQSELQQTLRSPIIGVDFDNTIVSYDSLFYTVAVEVGLFSLPYNPGKKAIRDSIRQLPHGEESWQELQSLVYGSRIGGAVLIDGVANFIAQCRQEGYPIYIISHKTEFANCGQPRANLREAALRWMYANQFFEESGLGLSPSCVCFGATRQEKIGYIRSLGCTHFIDDLEEVFLEKEFPSGAEKILYAPHKNEHLNIPTVTVFSTWEAITDHLFGTRVSGDAVL